MKVEVSYDCDCFRLKREIAQAQICRATICLNFGSRTRNLTWKYNEPCEFDRRNILR